MDGEMKQKIQVFAEQLLAQEKSEFRKAVTLRDLEEFTGQIGDELARQLANTDLTDRSREVAGQTTACCPECGRECPMDPEPEPIILQGQRSEIEYLEPRSHCPSCRRDFFPSG